MSSHGFDPHHRPTVKYVDDADLAYILLRYRESHDFYHTIYNLPPTVLGEIVLKYIELLDFKLGGAGMQAIVGSISLLDDGERKELMESYIPWVLKNFGDRRRLASGASLLEVFWEEELEEDIGERGAALKNLGNNSNQSLSLLISPPSQMPCAHD